MEVLKEIISCEMCNINLNKNIKNFYYLDSSNNTLGICLNCFNEVYSKLTPIKLEIIREKAKVKRQLIISR